jgi:sugar/nucleoside kinase (ribokinase family)
MACKENLKTPSVLGVGNALVDVMISLEDDRILRQFGLPRGSMTLVDSRLSQSIFEATGQWHRSITTGGSAANTIHTLANLGVSCGYVGKISHDEPGKIFEDEFIRQGVCTHLFYNHTGTGRVMAMVTPDSERTMATCLGAAAELKPDIFTGDLVKPYQYLYVEGYLVQDRDLIETILKTGHEEGLTVAVDLSSYNIVAQNREFLQYLIANYVDLVFANEEEAFAYTGFHPEEALAAISHQCKLAIVKTGKKGSLVQMGESTLQIEPVPARAIDTTGAGDCYSAGFLYGMSKGLTLRQCGDIASLISSKVVEIMGAKIPEDLWPGLLSEIRKIEGTSE